MKSFLQLPYMHDINGAQNKLFARTNGDLANSLQTNSLEQGTIA